MQLQADGGVILYKNSALLHRVIEISTLRPTGMFDKLRETQSDTLEPSDHYKIYLSASGGYAYLVFHLSRLYDSHLLRQHAHMQW